MVGVGGTGTQGSVCVEQSPLQGGSGPEHGQLAAQPLLSSTQPYSGWQ